MLLHYADRTPPHLHSNAVLHHFELLAIDGISSLPIRFRFEQIIRALHLVLAREADDVLGVNEGHVGSVFNSGF